MEPARRLTPGPPRAALHLVHLVRRFAGSLSAAGPEPGDEEWARSQLLPGERRLWDVMPAADRRHAVGVARRVDTALAPGADRPALAAALLHDVGKIEAGLGTPGRVAATLAGLAGGRRRAAAWASRPGPLGRVGRYLRHPALGAGLLRGAGSDPLTVAWAAEHHSPPERWSVPSHIGAALKAADDD